MVLAAAVLLTLTFIAVFVVITPAVKIAKKVLGSPKPQNEPQKETPVKSQGKTPSVEESLTRAQQRELNGLRDRAVDEYRLAGKVDIKAYVDELKGKLGYMNLGHDFIEGLGKIKPDSKAAYFREGKDGTLRIFWNGSLLYQIKTDPSHTFLRILPPDFSGISDQAKARMIMSNVMATGDLATKQGARDVLDRLEKVILCPDNIDAIKRDLLPEVIKGDSEAIPGPEGELRKRLDNASKCGISERFARDDGKGPLMEAHPISIELSKRSNMTLLESDNRALAGERFKGFNLIVEDTSRATLTYCGQAVASLTRFQKDEEATVDGKKEMTAVTYFRTNTFPPRLSDSILPSDIGAMLDARERIRLVDDDPNLVLDVMQDIVCEPGNVALLRSEVGPQVQEMESRRRSRELHPESVRKGSSEKL